MNFFLFVRFLSPCSIPEGIGTMDCIRGFEYPQSDYFFDFDPSLE
jgi:hypothetical protein